MVRLFAASALALTLSMPAAHAAHAHHHRHVTHRHADRYAARTDMPRGTLSPGARADAHPTTTGLGPKPPHAWCGWYARQLVGQDPGPAYNLAANWAHWGHAASPGVGVIVVWAHHVGMITGRSESGQWIVKSGNDGNAVRERPLSTARAIAFRAI
jgi:hypothetical protein